MFRCLVLISIFSCAFGATRSKSVVHVPDSRIIGGQNTTIEKFPYQAFLRYMGNFACGGSIINKRVIVTAAHCLSGASAVDIKVVVGTTFIYSGGVSYSVQKIVRHPKYNVWEMDYDIAIYILSNNLIFGSSVRPIALPKQGETPKPGAPAFASGWGVTHLDRINLSQTLQYVKVYVVGHGECKKKFWRTGLKITGSMLCASAEGRDACQGDSGGPLVSDNKLIGVISWGIDCAHPHFPGVYARVSAVRNWIDENSKF